MSSYRRRCAGAHAAPACCSRSAPEYPEWLSNVPCDLLDHNWPPALLRVGRAATARPALEDNLMFNEYFHGDNAAGLGASRQTGWTGIVANVIRRRHRAVPSIADVIRTMTDPGGRQDSGALW
jgi:hypothetical protein